MQLPAHALTSEKIFGSLPRDCYFRALDQAYCRWLFYIRLGSVPTVPTVVRSQPLPNVTRHPLESGETGPVWRRAPRVKQQPFYHQTFGRVCFPRDVLFVLSFLGCGYILTAQQAFDCLPEAESVFTSSPKSEGQKPI